MADIQINPRETYVVFTPPDGTGVRVAEVLAWRTALPDVMQPIAWHAGRTMLVSDDEAVVIGDISVALRVLAARRAASGETS